MPLTTTKTSITYVGNGTSLAFTFPYLFEENGDLFCYVINTTTGSGADTPLSLNVDYTVSGAGSETGGTVTMVVAPPTGSNLLIKRVLPLTQTSRYQPNGGIPVDQLNSDLDRGVMIDQQLSDRMDSLQKFGILGADYAPYDVSSDNNPQVSFTPGNHRDSSAGGYLGSNCWRCSCK